MASVGFRSGADIADWLAAIAIARSTFPCFKEQPVRNFFRSPSGSMSANDETLGSNAARPADAAAFTESLKRRRAAAQGLEQDLLTEVPLLYGSPGSLEPHGDPGIVLARAHREELVRRNGGGVMHPSGKRSEVALPFERTMAALVVLLLLFFLFGG